MIVFAIDLVKDTVVETDDEMTRLKTANLVTVAVVDTAIDMSLPAERVTELVVTLDTVTRFAKLRRKATVVADEISRFFPADFTVDTPVVAVATIC